MGPLGENVNQFQRTSPVNGLIQGLQAGSNFGLALRQQQMAEEQIAQQQKDREIQMAVQQMGQATDYIKSVKSVEGKKLGMKMWVAAATKAKLVPEGTEPVYNEEADTFYQKLGGLKKLAKENVPEYIAEVQRLMDESAKQADAGDITPEAYKQREGVVEAHKKEAAGHLGGTIRSGEYQGLLGIGRPETQSGREYVKEVGREQLAPRILGQINELDPAQANVIGDDLNKGQNKNLSFADWTDANGVQWRIGYDPTTGAEVSRVKQGKGKEQKRDAYKEDAVLTRVVDRFNADPNVRKTEVMDEFANLITTVAESDNPIGHASLETLMARASGEVGNLSEADKKPFGGSRALDAKAKQYFEEIYKGKKTPENLAFISKLAQTFKEVGKKKKISIARERAAQYAKANKGMGWTAKDVFEALMPVEEYEEPQSGAGKTASGEIKGAHGSY